MLKERAGIKTKQSAVIKNAPTRTFQKPVFYGGGPTFGIPEDFQPIELPQSDLAPGIPVAKALEPNATGAMVVRFHTAAKKKGISNLSTAGLKVASLSDFKEIGFEAALAENPDVLYFERFGIAIIQASEVSKASSAMASNSTVASQRPERVYVALGMASRLYPKTALANVNRDYLLGYKAGVDALIDQLLGESMVKPSPRTESLSSESAFTWGLQATLVDKSLYTGAGVRIAVLDTGFDDQHPDFVGRGITSKSFVTGEDVRDGSGHGTHTLGTIFGPKNNSAQQPRYGIAYGSELFVGKVLNNKGRGTDRTIIAGMQWALDQKCSIISMSLGAVVNPGDVYNDDYEHIGQVCLDTDCVVVAAAGNNSARPGVVAPVNSPANCPSILAVAAIDSDLQIASFSAGAVNQGQAIDLAAPGVDVLSSWPGGYRRLDGTSMATPHVAGIAALLAEKDPTNRGRKLWTSILQSCRSLPLPATDIGRGLIQAP